MYVRRWNDHTGSYVYVKNWRWVQRFHDAFLVLIGRRSLHRSWQNGYDRHIVDESSRRARGGN